MLQLQPLPLGQACRFIDSLHRHHKAPQGGFFAIAVNDGVKLVGVAIVGRPTPKAYQDGWTAEVTRHCTDGTPHVASMLYAACWRACRAMGYRRLGTYSLTTEPGTSLKAAKWVALYSITGRSWDTPSRPREYGNPAARTFWSPDEAWQAWPLPSAAKVAI